jgi:drug/metabolite transporter (DMT)-like permease
MQASPQRQSSFSLMTWFKSRRVKSDLMLAGAAFVWGAGFIAQSAAARHIGTFVFNGGRFLLGFLLLFLLSRGRWRPQRAQLPWMAGAGALLFMASGFQQAGLASTSVGNTGFITGLYVVFIPMIEWLLWRMRVRWTGWAAAGLAVLGTTLLGGGGSLSLGRGDTLVLIGSFFWALHVIVVGKAARQMNPASFSLGQFLFAGLFSAVAAFIFEMDTLPGLQYAWTAILFSAIFPIGVGFTLQAMGQENAPTLDAALILSLETVFAAMFGVLVLHEAFSWGQMGGALLILAAIVLSQIFPGQPAIPVEPANLVLGNIEPDPE